jgi:hypothetical protein
VREAKLFFWL